MEEPIFAHVMLKPCAWKLIVGWESSSIRILKKARDFAPFRM
jgi:hypothetical protein